MAMIHHFAHILAFYEWKLSQKKTMRQARMWFSQWSYYNRTTS